MSQSSAEESLIRRYLLGELPENEQDELEKRLLADQEFFETSRIIECELLDDYVLGSLSESDRINLECSLLVSAQQQRRAELIRLLRLKSNASVFAKKRSIDLHSALTGYFRSYRSGLDRAAWLAA